MQVAEAHAVTQIFGLAMVMGQVALMFAGGQRASVAVKVPRTGSMMPSGRVYFPVGFDRQRTIMRPLPGFQGRIAHPAPL